LLSRCDCTPQTDQLSNAGKIVGSDRDFETGRAFYSLRTPSGMRERSQRETMPLYLTRVASMLLVGIREASQTRSASEIIHERW